jgi:putative ABC transport system ATP-binding protein
LETADERASARRVVDARQLYKVYDGAGVEVPVLRGVDLVVGAGEIVALSGPSGSGKSTLLNILGCLDRATSGTYLLDGTDVSSLSRERQAWVRLHYIGFIFQSFHLLAQLTAFENVVLPLQYAGLPRAECERRGRALLERVGLSKRAGHLPKQLSGGERQRVAIARALIGAPRLVLADEPTGALDSKSGNEVMRLLLELHAESGTSIVLVTHDPRVAALSDRRVELLDGRVVDADEEQRVSA